MTRHSAKFDQICQEKGLNARLIKDLSKKLEVQLFERITQAIALHQAGGLSELESLAAIVQSYLGVQFKVLTLVAIRATPESRQASLDALRKDFDASFDDVPEALERIEAFLR